MKRIIFGIVFGFFLGSALMAAAAPSLAERLKGRILLAVEDKGKTYYVHSDGKRYRITQATALEIFKRLSIGISNKDLVKIPEGSVGLDPESGSTAPNSSVQAQPPAQTTSQKSWRTVTTFSGTGIKTTEPFTIRGSQWRVSWNTNGEYNFQIYPEQIGGSILTGCMVMANIIGNGADTSYCYKSGEFYLTVNTANSWSVTVEELY